MNILNLNSNLIFKSNAINPVRDSYDAKLAENKLMTEKQNAIFLNTQNTKTQNNKIPMQGVGQNIDTEA